MLKIKSVSKIFNQGQYNEFKALDNVSFDLEEGDWLTIIGTNGSGKSTLLNMIAGTLFPDSGSVFIDNCDVTKSKDFQRAKYISRVFQNPFIGTAPEMTIAENLLIALNKGKKVYPYNFSLKKDINFLKEKIAELGMQLENRPETMMNSLSGGQRQAISLLMSVLVKPKILLLDEHTAALDPKTSAQVIKLTKKFIEDFNLTTIMVTHSMEQALEFGNKTIMLYKGKIIEHLSLSDKKKLNKENLLDKFSDLRKKENLTDELFNKLIKEYN